MERAGLFGLVLALGVLGTADAACDASCQQSCQTKVLGCMSEMQNIGAGRAGTSNQTIADMCANLDSMDTCSLYGTVAKCLKDNVPAQCSDDANLKVSIDQTKAAVDQYCGTESTCSFALLKCQCKLMTTTGFSLNQFCATSYLSYEQCVEAVPSACLQSVEIKSSLEMAKNALSVAYYLYCPAAGGCESAMTCLKQISPESGRGFGMMGDSSSNTGVPEPPVPDILLPTVCGKLTVFDCLKTASSTCKLDQGETTMDEIKTAFSELCTEVLPKASSLTTCQMFSNCLQTFKGNPMMTTTVGETPTGEQVRSVGHYVAVTTRSGFWCSWTQHNYQCAIDNAQACDLAANVVTLGQQKLAALKTTCAGAATAPPPRESYTGGSPTVRATACLLSVVALVWALVL